MALLPEQLQRLLAMQTLCERVEGTAQELEAAVQKIAVLQQEAQALQDFYQHEWLELISDERLSEADRQAVQSAATGYSVLGQDTIWDALEQVRAVQVRLIKQLVQSL
jgi:hypothetical protein